MEDNKEKTLYLGGLSEQHGGKYLSGYITVESLNKVKQFHSDKIKQGAKNRYFEVICFYQDEVDKFGNKKLSLQLKVPKPKLNAYNSNNGVPVDQETDVPF